MPRSNATLKCAHCAHPRSVHITGTTGGCGKKIPVAWRGQGKTKYPIMGYCPCPRFKPKEV